MSCFAILHYILVLCLICCSSVNPFPLYCSFMGQGSLPLSPNALKKSVSLICRNMISCHRGSAACKILPGLTLQAKLPKSHYPLLPRLYQPCPTPNPLSRRSISTSHSPHNQHSNPFPVLVPPQYLPLRSLVSKVSRPEADRAAFVTCGGSSVAGYCVC